MFDDVTPTPEAVAGFLMDDLVQSFSEENKILEIFLRARSQGRGLPVRAFAIVCGAFFYTWLVRLESGDAETPLPMAPSDRERFIKTIDELAFRMAKAQQSCAILYAGEGGL